MGSEEHERVGWRQGQRLGEDGAATRRTDRRFAALRVVRGHQRPPARVAEQHDPLHAPVAQPLHAHGDLGERVVEEEVRVGAAKPGVPPEEPEAAGGQELGEVVLGEVDVVVRGDERGRRVPPVRGRVEDALAGVATGASPAHDGGAEPDELPIAHEGSVAVSSSRAPSGSASNPGVSRHISTMIPLGSR